MSVRLSTMYVKSRLISEYYRRAVATLEPLMVKCDVLNVSGCHFSSCDIDAVLDFVLGNFFLLFLYSCTILY